MQLDSPVFETVFTLSSLFLGGPGLSILYQDWGRDFAGETDSIEEQLLVTHLFLVRLCRWSRIHCGSAFSHPSLVHSSRSFCVARQSSFKTVYSHSSLWFFFFVKPKLSIDLRKKLRKGLNGWNPLQYGSTISHPCLAQSSRIYSVAQQSSFRNSFHTLLYVLLVFKVLAS